MVLSLATFYTEYANPLSIPLAAGERITRLADVGLGSENFEGSEILKQALGVASILVLAALIAGASTVLLDWPRRFGAFTIPLTVGLAPSLLPHQVVALFPVVVGGGVVCDVLARLLRPGPERSLAWRGFSFVGLAIFFGLYFTAMALSVGLAWTPELWLGSILLAGLVGLLLSLLVAPVTARAAGGRPPGSGGVWVGALRSTGAGQSRAPVPHERAEPPFVGRSQPCSQPRYRQERSLGDQPAVFIRPSRQQAHP